MKTELEWKRLANLNIGVSTASYGNKEAEKVTIFCVPYISVLVSNVTS